MRATGEFERMEFRAIAHEIERRARPRDDHTMTKEESRLRVMREWISWRDANGVTAEARGNDALRFYTHLQSNHPELLRFRRSRDRWEVVHDWLLGNGCVRD